MRSASGGHLCLMRVAMSHRTLTLSDDERTELEHLRAHAPKPYLRERAAALLKIAQGEVALQVARSGLLQPRDPDTLYAWLNRFRDAGVAGLTIRPGRGRKPSFSPCARHTRGGAGCAAPGDPT